METLLCQKVCKINTFICNSKTILNDYQSIAQKQMIFDFSRPKVPLSLLSFMANAAIKGYPLYQG